MDESTGVNPGASTGTEVSSTPSADTGTTPEASSGMPSGTPAEQTATQSESVAAGDAAGAEEEPEWLLSEEQIQEIPDQWREKHTSLLGGYKSLESDHRMLKKEHEALTTRAAALDGLGAYATDQNGHVIRDQNGFPLMTTSPFLEQLSKQENGAYLTDQLAADIWHMQRPGMNGETYGDALLKMVGLDPTKIDQYKAGAQSQVTGNSLTAEQVKSVVDIFGNQAYGEALKQLTPSEQDVIIDLLNENDPTKDLQAEAILKREAGRLENDRKLQQVERTQQQYAQQEVKTFWSTAEAAYTKHIEQTNRDAIATLTKQISSQVTFSADPATNTIQTNAIGGLIAAICHQPTRFAMEPVLEALGVKLDPQFDAMFEQWQSATQDYMVQKTLAENARFGQNPDLAKYRNDQKMNQARDAANGMQQRILAKLAPIGAKLAKVLAGQNQELRDQKNVNLQAAQNGRPTLGVNGSLAPNGKQIPQGIDPFSVEFLRQIS